MVGRQLITTLAAGEIGAIVTVFPAQGLTDGIVKRYGYMTLEPRIGTPARRYALAGASIWTNGGYVRGAVVVGGTELWINWRQAGIPFRFQTG